MPTKVALVTGAARGIGLAAAARFLDDGWHVAVLDILGDTLRVAVKALEAAVQHAQQQFGRIDPLVNNAGIAVFKPMMDVTLENGSGCWQST